MPIAVTVTRLEARGLGGGGVAASGDEEVVHGHGDEGAVGDVVRRHLRLGVVAGAAVGRVAIDGPGAEDDGVVEAGGPVHVLGGQGVLARARGASRGPRRRARWR